MSSSLSDGQFVAGKKEGYWTTYYANGNKRSEGGFRAGIKEGKWILYHRTGKKQSKTTFRNGKYEGHYVSYHENGNKFREGGYSEYQGNSYDGRKEGVWYQYDKVGNIETKVTYKHGRITARETVSEVEDLSEFLP